LIFWIAPRPCPSGQIDCARPFAGEPPWPINPKLASIITVIRQCEVMINRLGLIGHGAAQGLGLIGWPEGQGRGARDQHRAQGFGTLDAHGWDAPRYIIAAGWRTLAATGLGPTGAGRGRLRPPGAKAGRQEGRKKKIARR